MDHKLYVDLLPDSSDFLFDLHTSASIGCEERVQNIIDNLDNKWLLNQQNKKGWSPLMYAVCSTNIKVVLLLLYEGADVNVKNKEGHTALMLASKYGSVDIICMLLENNAPINDKDENGWTALFHAVALGHRSVVQLLIDKGARADLADYYEKLTPLMLASAAGDEMMVQDLLHYGVNPLAESKTGETARSIAVNNGHVDVRNLIDTHVNSKKFYLTPNFQSPDLQTLLSSIHLCKYYCIFEKHEIDLNTFWMLTDEDLKEIGIQLIGPRKKICCTISRWHQNHALNGTPEEISCTNRMTIENGRLLQEITKLKKALTQEKELKLAAEQNLSKGIQTLKNFNHKVQYTLGYAVHQQEKLKESYLKLKTLLCNLPSGIAWSKSKVGPIFQLLESMEELMNDIHHQTEIALKQTNF